MEESCFKYSWKKIQTRILDGKYKFVIQVIQNILNNKYFYCIQDTIGFIYYFLLSS